MKNQWNFGLMGWFDGSYKPSLSWPLQNYHQEPDPYKPLPLANTTQFLKAAPLFLLISEKFLKIYCFWPITSKSNKPCLWAPDETKRKWAGLWNLILRDWWRQGWDPLRLYRGCRVLWVDGWWSRYRKQLSSLITIRIIIKDSVGLLMRTLLIN